MSVPRTALLVSLLAAGAYANSLGNGFAYDDEGVVSRNPLVTEGNWSESLSQPYWPGSC